jgi:proteasome beta subunit
VYILVEIMADEKLSTGTTTLSIVCKDGIVVAADKRMTAGRHIFAEGVEKVIPINNKMMLTIAGSVQPAQTAVKLIKAETKLNKLRLGRENTVKEVANILASLTRSTMARSGGYEAVHFLFAGQNADGSFELYDCFPDGTVTPIRKYQCSGSGGSFAEGVLEALYTPNMSVTDALVLAKKALNSAVQKDSASGNGADLYKLTKNGVEKAETINLRAVIE